jgi:hypothetical protein
MISQSGECRHNQGDTKPLVDRWGFPDVIRMWLGYCQSGEDGRVMIKGEDGDPGRWLGIPRRDQNVAWILSGR